MTTAIMPMMLNSRIVVNNEPDTFSTMGLGLDKGKAEAGGDAVGLDKGEGLGVGEKLGGGEGDGVGVGAGLGDGEGVITGRMLIHAPGGSVGKCASEPKESQTRTSILYHPGAAVMNEKFEETAPSTGPIVSSGSFSRG